MAFDVATYTDVAASEAVDGVDGFNFQAVSSGVTGADQQQIRARLLHRIVPSWALGNDALRHPATCAYIVQGGRFYLSRGESTGDTNSGRPGNQITQAIVTSDPDDFVPYRPAQLYGATHWKLEKAPRSSADPWITPLEIRPEFEVPALEAFVAADEWAVAVLPYYLTMLEAAIAPEPKKLVLLHHDLDVVMRWIALGSLFLDTDSARTLQFRALVDDPWRADAMVVGVSPDFGRGDLGAANVLNLVQKSMPGIEPSNSARVRAGWFLDHGADDALSAIEIARRWEPSLGTDLAIEAARVVGLPDDPTQGRTAWRASVASTELLAVAGLRDDLALYAEELCEASFGYGPSDIGEFSLVGRAIRKAHDLDVDELVSEILVPTLEALTAAPSSIEAFARELSGASAPVRWESAEAQEAAGVFVAELLNSVSVHALPELLGAAKVIAAPVAPAELNAAIRRLSSAWLQEPAIGLGRWQHWLAGPAVVEDTVQQLILNLRDGDNPALTSLLEGDWDFLGQHSEDLELHGWLEAAKLARIPVDDRNDQAGLTSPLPAEAWRVVLAGSRLPQHAGLWATWITSQGLPDAMAAALTAVINRALAGEPGSTGVIYAGDWRPIMRSLSGSADPELTRLVDDYSVVQTAFRSSRDEVRADSAARLDACLPHAGRLAPLFLSDIGWLVLNSANPGEIEKLFQAVSPWGPEAIRATLRHLAATNHGMEAIDSAIHLRSNPDGEISAAADKALAEILKSHPDLLDGARVQPRLRGVMDKYLGQQQSHAFGGIRKLSGPFRRNKEK
ncbi:hypothetical protein ARTSIC4J27_989 [Pseudarthrobacter siccitolerans]|uniref:Uncharacterized protein n=1 Tax=Pseudarthrobacter siccitolerans TaxID=861266 RepID=A0A024H009_9MICC|nr:hypothetical protein [Pseudarthrobacter siccitolerans]CCQ45056.1 hypothetical protein ARTSIC4J27_989 [Pseudarthrobacter siccitolerans]